ncbi:SMI1/KNR4 family protein [Prosthecobacter sp.]|uniref:SMI1/KNR4 family protein n=1 Tax=Prosthecobacter sp. TaxID=1965333 RepID=UPI00378336B0
MASASNSEGLAIVRELSARKTLGTDLGELRVRVPAGAADLARTEGLIGVRFPWFLRALFLEVGNGGFGPGYGVMGICLAGADARPGISLEETHLEHSAWCAECGFDWPKDLVPLIDHGCGIYTCLDCADEELNLHEYDPNFELEETDPQWLKQALRPLGKTLEGLLGEWLARVKASCGRG